MEPSAALANRSGGRSVTANLTRDSDPTHAAGRRDRIEVVNFNRDRIGEG
jgi:hypothetical protein